MTEINPVILDIDPSVSNTICHRLRRLERRQDYLDKKLEAWVMTVEELYMRKK